MSGIEDLKRMLESRSTEYGKMSQILSWYLLNSDCEYKKPMLNAHRFNSAEDAYNACPKFCDIDVKTMTERELKIVVAVIKCFVWLYSPVEDGASA